MIKFSVTTFWFLRNIKHHNHATFMNQKVVTENFIIELTGDKYFSTIVKIRGCHTLLCINSAGARHPLASVQIQALLCLPHKRKTRLKNVKNLLSLYILLENDQKNFKTSSIYG